MFILKGGEDGGQPWIITLYQFISASSSWEVTRQIWLSPCCLLQAGLVLAGRVIHPTYTQPLPSDRLKHKGMGIRVCLCKKQVRDCRTALF